MDMNFDPEAFSDEWEELQKLISEMVAEELVILLLEVGIAKLEAEMAEQGLDFEPEYWDESMDGDHESALASAGFGTDEDYGGGTHDWEDGGDYWAD
jgi:hypothetical protein